MRRSVALACLLPAGPVHADDGESFRAPFVQSCISSQAKLPINANVSKWMIGRYCTCAADKMLAALQSGLIDGIDDRRAHDVMVGHANLAARQCIAEMVPPLPPDPVWIRSGSNSRSVVYTDGASILVAGRKVTTIEVRDYTATQVFAMTNEPFLSMKSRQTYDCDARTVVEQFLYIFSDPMGEGTLVATAAGAGSSAQVAPSTHGATLLAFACKGL